MRLNAGLMAFLPVVTLSGWLLPHGGTVSGLTAGFVGLQVRGSRLITPAGLEPAISGFTPGDLPLLHGAIESYHIGRRESNPQAGRIALGGTSGFIRVTALPIGGPPTRNPIPPSGSGQPRA